jgi:FPC/CPF motif-containing protein YcgG
MSGTSSQILKTNPFSSSERESAHSAYTAWDGDKLVFPLDPTRSLEPTAKLVHDAFRARVFDSDFPCVGAKAAINHNTYRFGFYFEMNTLEATSGLAHDLWEFVRERQSLDTNYATYVASFAGPVFPDEQIWEKALWTQLQRLHDLDKTYHGWDDTVSSDPSDFNYSFSFAETGFFVVGLHPASSRYARRFPWPTLVFNPHDQFEQLREQNQFERMRKTIRVRDYNLQGSLNPNLNNFGEQSEARQYSGRAVEEDWRCPFRAQTETDEEQPD